MTGRKVLDITHKITSQCNSALSTENKVLPYNCRTNVARNSVGWQKNQIKCIRLNNLLQIMQTGNIKMTVTSTSKTKHFRNTRSTISAKKTLVKVHYESSHVIWECTPLQYILGCVVKSSCKNRVPLLPCPA